MVDDRDSIAFGQPPGHGIGEQTAHGIDADDRVGVLAAMKDRDMDLELPVALRHRIGRTIHRVID